MSEEIKNLEEKIIDLVLDLDDKNWMIDPYNEYVWMDREKNVFVGKNHIRVYKNGASRTLVTVLQKNDTNEKKFDELMHKLDSHFYNKGIKLLVEE